MYHKHMELGVLPFSALFYNFRVSTIQVVLSENGRNKLISVSWREILETQILVILHTYWKYMGTATRSIWIVIFGSPSMLMIDGSRMDVTRSIFTMPVFTNGNGLNGVYETTKIEKKGFCFRIFLIFRAFFRSRKKTCFALIFGWKMSLSRKRILFWRKNFKESIRAKKKWFVDSEEFTKLLKIINF